MKAALVTIVIIVGIVPIIIGKIYWESKISAFSGMKSSLVVEEAQAEVAGESSGSSSEAQPKDFSQFTKNLPDKLKQLIEDTKATKEPVKLAILGSQSTSSEPNGWPSILSEQLTATYGENVFKVSVTEIKDKNSVEVVTEELYEESVNFKPDVLLFEPFILKDNGEVRMNDRLENIVTIINAFKESNPEIVVFLQPANPLYNATYYPKEVEELKRFASDNNILYLDHWQAWPDLDASEMEGYLTTAPNSPGKSIPNEKGNEVWANFLVDYFISK